MESTNLHHLQNQNHSSSSSALHASSSSSSYFGVATGTTTNITLNGDYKLKQNLQDTNYRSPRSRSANSMIEAGLGYNNNNNNEWASSTTNTGSCLSSESCEDGHDHYHLDLHHHHHHQYNNNYNSKMKEEISDNINVVGFPTKFTEMLNTTSTMDQKDFNALSDKLLYSAITSPNFSSSGVCGGMGNLGIIRGGSFTQIHPTVNISSFTQTTSSSSLPSFNNINNNMQCSLSESSDLFHGGLVITNHHDNHNHNHNHDADLFHPRFADSLSFRRLQHMQMQQQQPIHTSSCIVSNSTNNPISEFTNGMVAEAKRPINTTLVESKASHQSQTVPKKSRLESRSSSSCPPFKVRKEKLGDRIAALQQLVAPFGKTDTASVLMEAIGYIKFLQNQVETLSVPYMKSSRKQNNRAMQGVSEGKQEEGKVDLRSRGLCLVPLSCMSYFTGDGGTGLMWQHSDHFGGPT